MDVIMGVNLGYMDHAQKIYFDTTSLTVRSINLYNEIYILININDIKVHKSHILSRMNLFVGCMN